MLATVASRMAVVVVVVGTLATAAAAEPIKPPAAQKPNTQTEQCATEACHVGIVGRKVMHGPVAQRKCLACHAYDQPQEHRFTLTASVQRLCTDCHTLQHRTVLHAPVKDGNCTGCHDPHGSDHKRMLVADLAKGLCETCHKQQQGTTSKYVHGPVATGACVLCHEAHSSWQPKLLTETPEKLCATCHNDTVPSDERGRHVHAPVKDGNCVACHDSHASGLKYQLREAAPKLCVSCHKPVGDALATSPVVHGAVTEEAGCTSCHAPHSSQLPKLQRAAEPKSCLGCHDKPLKTDGGGMIANMASLLKENAHLHGPIREGACTACHEPHAGKNFRLLTAAYPPQFYAPFEIERYALCFKCHIPDLVLKEQGTGLTQFRQGDVNLHWVHVNREKGRTCRACHEVHASRNPFHIRDAVPFGTSGWMLEIGYKQTPAGGSCSPGCHKPKDYDRDARGGGGEAALSKADAAPAKNGPTTQTAGRGVK